MQSAIETTGHCTTNSPPSSLTARAKKGKAAPWVGLQRQRDESSPFPWEKPRFPPLQSS